MVLAGFWQVFELKFDPSYRACFRVNSASACFAYMSHLPKYWPSVLSVLESYLNERRLDERDRMRLVHLALQRPTMPDRPQKTRGVLSPIQGIGSHVDLGILCQLFCGTPSEHRVGRRLVLKAPIVRNVKSLSIERYSGHFRRECNRKAKPVHDECLSRDRILTDKIFSGECLHNPPVSVFAPENRKSGFECCLF
jgi:hypothetical protein